LTFDLDKLRKAKDFFNNIELDPTVPRYILLPPVKKHKKKRVRKKRNKGYFDLGILDRKYKRFNI